jgi:hypothetical protein
VRKFLFSFSLVSDIFCSDFYFFLILFFMLIFYFVLWCLRAYKTLECKANVSTQIEFLFVNFLHYYCSSYKTEKHAQVKILIISIYAKSIQLSTLAPVCKHKYFYIRLQPCTLWLLRHRHVDVIVAKRKYNLKMH